MSIAGSQVSRFKQPLNVKRTFAAINGELVPTSYDIKSLSYTGEIKVKNPQIMNTMTSGDKQITIKYLQFYDQRIHSNVEQTNLARIFRLVVKNQRNNFDENGNQTNVVGYLTYDISKKIYQADSQPYEMDSKQPVVIQIQEQTITTLNNVVIRDWIDLVIDYITYPLCYIYSDINISFEDID